MMKKNASGITLVTLAVTIAVIIILAGVSISMITGDNSAINKAGEAKIMSDFETVEDALELYKIKQDGYNNRRDEITDESLVGSLYKKVIVKDTKRELGVIVDFQKIDISPNYGQGGKKLLEEDNNDMNSTTEIDNIYELANIYAVDLTDGNLYFINKNQIYSKIDKVEVAENGSTSFKYNVELLNSEYTEKTKFKTKWNVTLGESEGSSTYSTVILPVDVNSEYDATIYWGDNTSTQLKHKVDGVTLSSSELQTKVTHQYTLSQNDDGIREIEILGVYSNFSMPKTTTFKKLVGIKQWGNVGFKAVSFSKCENLSGEIPSPNVDECFTQCTSLVSLFESCKNLTGSIPSNLFDSAVNCTNFNSAFVGCNHLEGEIPNIFKKCTSARTLDKTFSGLTNVNKLSSDFTIPDSVTSMGNTFTSVNLNDLPSSFRLPSNVTNIGSLFESSTIKSLPEGFTMPNTVKNVKRMFMNCKNLEKLPNSFNISNGVTTITEMFRECSNLTELPANLKIPEGSTDLELTFGGCSKLKKLPDAFTIPSTVKSLKRTFTGCSQLTELPANFTISQGVTNLEGTFAGSGILNLPSNFSIPNSVTDMGATFYNCTNLESLPDNFSIPENVVNTYSSYFRAGTFESCSKLKGTLTIRANLSNYTKTFNLTSKNSGGTLTVNYTSNCTNIDNILATGDSNYIKKGNLVQ